MEATDVFKLEIAGGEQQQKVAVADANAAWLLKRERRCDQKGRGSIYDSTAGESICS